MPDLVRSGVEYRAAPHHPVQPGQVWASNHNGDRQASKRQHREVLEVWSETVVRTGAVELYADVVTVDLDGTRRRKQRVRLNGTSIPGHRLVTDAQEGTA